MELSNSSTRKQESRRENSTMGSYRAKTSINAAAKCDYCVRTTEIKTGMIDRNASRVWNLVVGPPIAKNRSLRIIVVFSRQSIASREFRHHQIELEHKLGEGAFEKSTPAIKTLKCANVTKEKIEESMKEARMMRELNHPNIVHFYGLLLKKNRQCDCP
uniref:Protein kinase domain-containing protein n=1 Tax=Ditylenchus dipsaci TaxID=166011 RepID=A0A915ENF9_9BILA